MKKLTKAFLVGGAMLGGGAAVLSHLADRYREESAYDDEDEDGGFFAPLKVTICSFRRKDPTEATQDFKDGPGPMRNPETQPKKEEPQEAEKAPEKKAEPEEKEPEKTPTRFPENARNVFIMEQLKKGADGKAAICPRCGSLKPKLGDYCPDCGHLLHKLPSTTEAPKADA
jgi:hypothetical protein